MEARLILLTHLVEDHIGIPIGRFLQNRGKRRARVLGINIDAIGKDRLMGNIAAREIEAPLHRNVQPVFEVLSYQLSQDHLLGEVL